jgi:hypothetical protein
MLTQGQATAARSLLEHEQDTQADGVIHTVMWDETQFSVVPNGSGTAVTSSVFAAHGALTLLLAGGGRLRAEQIVHPPNLLADTTAASYWAALCRHTPCPLMLQRHAATYIGFCPGSDHAKSCLRLHNYIENSAPDWVFTIRGLCKQHATGLCVQPLCVYFDLICPAFCAVKMLHSWTFYNRFEAAVFHVVATQLDWQPADSAFVPDPADRAYAEALLEQAYYSRNLHECEVELEKQEKLKEEDAKRRQRGERLIRACPGDWRSTKIVHISRGCCQNSAEGAHCVVDALKDCY